MKIIFFYSEENKIGTDKLPKIYSKCKEIEADFESINIDNDEDAMQDFNISSIPAVVKVDDDGKMTTLYGKNLLKLTF